MIDIHIQFPDGMFLRVHDVFESALNSVSNDVLYPDDSIKYVLSFVRESGFDQESQLQESDKDNSINN